MSSRRSRRVGRDDDHVMAVLSILRELNHFWETLCICMKSNNNKSDAIYKEIDFEKSGAGYRKPNFEKSVQAIENPTLINPCGLQRTRLLRNPFARHRKPDFDKSSTSLEPMASALPMGVIDEISVCPRMFSTWAQSSRLCCIFWYFWLGNSSGARQRSRWE